MYLTACFFHGTGSISVPRRNISRDFSMADHTLPTRPASTWQKMAQSPLNGTTQPIDSEEESRHPAMERQCMKKNV